jgi:hypothetical protein
VSFRIRRLVIGCALALALAPLASPAANAAALPAPVAAGTSAANMTLNTASRWVLMRWVARQTGTLATLHMRIEAEGSACDQRGHTGYGLGNGGTWHVTTHPVLADGRPDMSATLATQDFRPCDAPLVPDVLQEIVRIPQGIAVRRGEEYATVIRNTDPEPARNFTSTNFLYTSTGILGANGRNERSADAPDAYYGLDPRELVGYSTDAGGTWALPGGQYGAPGGRSFLPTYLQEYADGTVTGQPFYYTAGTSTAPRTMVFRNIRSTWTISALGAYSAGAGTGTLTLTVDGEERAQRTVTGPGMMRAEIPAVTVLPGQTVKVTASGLLISNVVADTAWGRLMGMHLASSPFFVENERNFTHAAPVYALPAYGTDAASPAAPAQPPSAPPATPPPTPPVTPPTSTPPVTPPPTPPVTVPSTPPVTTPPVTTPPTPPTPPVTVPSTPPVSAPPTPPVVTPPPPRVKTPSTPPARSPTRPPTPVTSGRRPGRRPGRVREAGRPQRPARRHRHGKRHKRERHRASSLLAASFR